MQVCTLQHYRILECSSMRSISIPVVVLNLVLGRRRYWNFNHEQTEQQMVLRISWSRKYAITCTSKICCSMMSNPSETILVTTADMDT